MNAAARRIEAAEGALAGRRLLFCVGAQRAGTSWLDAMLRGHPEVHVPALKEVHYWDALRSPDAAWHRKRAEPELAWYREASLVARVRRYHLRALVQGAAVERMLETRAALFRGPSRHHAAYAELLTEGSRPGQLLVDNTPSYALVGRDGFAEMAALADARFVFVMRDPVDRLWSGVRHRLGEADDGAARERFGAAIEAAGDRDLARSDYPSTILALDAAVDRHRVLYLFHETLFAQASMDRLTGFLGIARRRARPWRRVNRARGTAARPDAATIRRARERLAPVYDFVRERFGPDVPATWMQ